MSQLNKKDLEQYINNTQAIDNSEEIQTKKHSSIIKNEIKKILDIKKLNLSPKETDNKCSCECFFLFKNYTQIYNLFVKKNLDYDIFEKLLLNLEKIENGELSQHDASVEVGKLLKTVYIDSVVKECKEDDNNYNSVKNSLNNESKNISWLEYKTSIMNKDK